MEHAGCRVIRVRAPRLSTHHPNSAEVERVTAQLTGNFQGADVVVNCAGNPDASSSDHQALTAANAILPGLVGAAASRAGVARYIHVSSAVVQGRSLVLDSTSSTDTFSPYAKSKAEGELAARSQGPVHTTVYRPPSVHGPSRRVTQQLSRIAHSRASTVARPGTAPTPQTTIDNVASALAVLAWSATPPPPIVHHPWEGHSTASLLQQLGGGRLPTLLPVRLARVVLNALRIAARVVPRLRPHVRRVELVWFGQEQAPSWLTEQGWCPLTNDDDWVALGRAALLARAASRERPPA